MKDLRSITMGNTESHRLEIYMESYNAEPTVHEVDHKLSINIGDEITREDWLEILSVPNGEIELKVKVEDVRHLFWDNHNFMHSVSIRVVPVD
jgi:hypothetical protein